MHVMKENVIQRELEAKNVSWQEKKKGADNQEEAITKLIKEHTKWV